MSGEREAGQRFAKVCRTVADWFDTPGADGKPGTARELRGAANLIERLVAARGVGERDADRERP